MTLLLFVLKVFDILRLIMELLRNWIGIEFFFNFGLVRKKKVKKRKDIRVNSNKER